MNAKITVAALVAMGLALTVTQAQAESRLAFINKYIERYAKVKQDGTIAGYKVSSLTGDSATSTSGDQPRSITRRLSALRKPAGKKY